VPWASEPRLSRCFDPLDGDRGFTAENVHTISTDTHSDHMVIPLRGVNRNVAGTAYFAALLDQNLLIARSNGVRDHPGGAAPGGGTGGWILSVLISRAISRAQA
jgi:hypothetical protein